MKMKLVVLSCVFAAGLQGEIGSQSLMNYARRLMVLAAALEDWHDVLNDGESPVERGERFKVLKQQASTLVVKSIASAKRLKQTNQIYYRNLVSAKEKNTVLGQLEDLSFNVNMLAWHVEKQEKAEACARKKNDKEKQGAQVVAPICRFYRRTE